MRRVGDLLNTLVAIAGKGAGFRSLGDAWADRTTPHGRLMLTVLGGLTEFERKLIRARCETGGRPKPRTNLRNDRVSLGSDQDRGYLPSGAVGAAIGNSWHVT